MQEQVRASGSRRAIGPLAIVVLGIVASVFFRQFYFVRELALFVGIAAILAVFVGNLMVLGILFNAAGQSILQAVGKAAAQEKATAGSAAKSGA